MQAVDYGSGGGPDAMVRVEMPVPKPKTGQVLIEVAFAGVNRSDTFQRAGSYPAPPGASPILGLEVSGTVVDKGSLVTSWNLGDHVCALVAGGGYAEFCVADAKHCLPVPRGLSLAEAAALPENLFTVWTNLVERARMAPGETVLIHGGSSGIGYLAIQLSKNHGAKVFTTVGNAEKARFCREIGADLVVNYRSEDFVREIFQATDNQGVDIVLDMVGGDYIPRNIRILKPEGRLVQISFLKGSKVADLDFRPIMTRRLTITGSTLRPLPPERKATIASDLRKHVWPLLEEGKIRVRIDREFTLAQVQKAHRYMESGKHLGKIVLRVGSASVSCQGQGSVSHLGPRGPI